MLDTSVAGSLMGSGPKSLRATALLWIPFEGNALHFKEKLEVNSLLDLFALKVKRDLGRAFCSLLGPLLWVLV